MLFRSNVDNPKLYNVIDNTKVIDTFKNFFTKYKYFYDAKHFKYFNINNLESEFFYFPLHVEPEISTNLWAPFFTNQLEVIRNIAISLPGNYTLIVKEHPRQHFLTRDKYFFKRLKMHKQISYLISDTISTKELIKKSKFVDNYLGRVFRK